MLFTVELQMFLIVRLNLIEERSEKKKKSEFNKSRPFCTQYP